MTTMSTSEFEIKLIQQIKHRKCIYDRTDTDFKDKSFKMKNWEAISKALNKPVQECQKKWKVLRETLRICLKSEKNNQNGIKWKYYNNLKFLLPFMGLRNDKQSYSHLISSSPVHVDEFEIREISSGEDSTELVESESNYEHIDKKQKISIENSQTNETLQNGTHANEKRSRADYFYTSLAKRAEMMSSEQQSRLEMRCLEIFYEIEFERERQVY